MIAQLRKKISKVNSVQNNNSNDNFVLEQKNENANYNTANREKNFSINNSSHLNKTKKDYSYVYNDTKKTGIIISIILLFNFILFFLIKNNIISLEFFGV